MYELRLIKDCSANSTRSKLGIYQRYIKLLPFGEARWGFIALLTAIAMGVEAQTKPVTGELTLVGGTGNINPWDASLKLDYHKGRLTLKPYVCITGLSGSNNGQLEEISYHYTASGSLYGSQLSTQTEGQQYRYGLAATFAQDARTQWTLSVDGLRSDLQRTGWLNEQLTIADAGQQAKTFSMKWAENATKQTTDRLQVEAAMRRQLEAGSWGARYTFTLTSADEDMEREGFLNADNHPIGNHLAGSTTTAFHTLLADYQRPLTHGQTLGLGARFDYRHIGSDDMQTYNGTEILDETFEHDMTVAAAFAEYRLLSSHISAGARLEYNYTRMNHHDLNDVIPMLRAQWNLSGRQSLALSYAMRLIRPEARVLNPAQVHGAFTLDYGNPDLDGTHAHVWALAHTLRNQRLHLTTTLSHIRADDGITAIWMVKDNFRVSTFGNEGIRRAWSLSPDLSCTITPTTSLDARLTLMWDKRVAEAINMAKEHWGISSQLALRQQLPLGLKLQVRGEYSEGNTLDLYSHSGRQLSYGGRLQRSFLSGGRLTTTLAYSNTDYAPIILTQGAYTGTVYTRPQHHHVLSITAALRF